MASHLFFSCSGGHLWTRQTELGGTQLQLLIMLSGADSPRGLCTNSRWSQQKTCVLASEQIWPCCSDSHRHIASCMAIRLGLVIAFKKAVLWVCALSMQGQQSWVINGEMPPLVWRTGTPRLPDGPKKLQLAVEEKQQFKDLDRQQGDAFTEQPREPTFRIFVLVLEAGSTGSSLRGWIAMML